MLHQPVLSIRNWFVSKVKSAVIQTVDFFISKTTQYAVIRLNNIDTIFYGFYGGCKNFKNKRI